MIKINNLNKFYNKGKSNQIHVINDTSIELPSKGLITFLGHSGSGKTTLLNVIGGLDKFNSGNISFDDKEFNKYKMSKIDKFRSRNVGYVFQNYNLLLEETVYDNLRIALDLIGVTDLEEQKKRIEYSLKAVGMFKYRKKVASFLSGGQQQRVSIARALVKKSKVIIADEPTGNLDSKNTMDVMNILKKISKQSLVLLVTHENDVANFYSDIIYEVKDGKIIGSKEAKADVTFNSNVDESTIYLKDLNETKLNTELGDVLIHSDSDEPLKINLDVIVKNGNIYLKADKPIKLLEQSNIKVVNDNYKEMKREDVDDFEYDTSWYDDKKDDSKKLKKFAKRISNSFISFRAVGKKQKFLYICLAFIGVIMAVSFAVLSFATNVDNNAYSYSKNINTAYRKEDNIKKSISSVFEDAYEEGEITDIYPLDSVNVSYFENIVYNHYFSNKFTLTLVPNFDYNLEISKGNKPVNSNDVAISYDVAKKIADETGRSIDNVIGLPITLNKYYYGEKGMTCNIVGISKNDNKMIYISPVGYEKYNSYTDWKSYRDFNYLIDNNYYQADYDVRYKEYEEYEISDGIDLNLNNSEFEVLISEKLPLEIGDYISFHSTGSDTKTAKVVGKFKDSDSLDSISIILNKKAFHIRNYEAEFISNNSDRVRLIEGTYPTKADEVMVSCYSMADVEIGKTIMIESLGKKMKIVGIFNSKDYNYCSFVSLSTYTLSTYYLEAGKIAFNVLDQEKLNQRFYENGIAIDNVQNYVISTALKERREMVKEFFVVFAVTSAVAAVFVYFIMRSKMMSDIYNIGVYRSLGSSRLRINNKYLSDIFILTTFTCLIGYILGIIGYLFISYIFNSVANELIGQNIMVGNVLVFILGGLSLYLIMYIFGMLPIIMLERKTPSEIIAKYDI